MTDFIQTFLKRNPFLFLALRFPSKNISDAGKCGLCSQDIFDIIGQQFLVLLFVMYPYFNQVEYFITGLVLQDVLDSVGNIFPIFVNLGDTRPGHEPTVLPLRSFAHIVVIAVEQIGKIGMEYLVIIVVFHQDKLLKKPCGMGQMPFWW